MTIKESESPTQRSFPVSVLAMRYAGALFQTAQEREQSAQLEAELERIQSLMQDSAELSRVLQAPLLRGTQQQALLAKLHIPLGTSPLLRNFLALLVRKRRLSLFPEVIRAFRQIAARDRRELCAEITSAQPLSDSQKEALQRALEEVSGKKIMIQHRLDPSLIGGFLLRLGSWLLDSSLKTKLAVLHKKMKGSV